MTVPTTWFDDDDQGGSVIQLVGRVTADPQAHIAADLALEAAGLGSWEIVPVTGESRWSSRAKSLLGFTADDQVTYERFIRSLRPPDRGHCIDAFVRVIEAGGDATFRIAVCVAKGTPRWLALTGASYIDGGAAVRLVGTIQDVTAEKLHQLQSTSRSRKPSAAPRSPW
ncbi:MAG: hypothetical protein ACJ79H_05670 [Myxococcales bacterium]